MNLEELKQQIRDWEVEAIVSKEEIEFYWRPVKVMFHHGGEVREYVIHFPWRENAFPVEEMVLQDPVEYGDKVVKHDISMVREPLARQLERQVEVYEDAEDVNVLILGTKEELATDYTLEDYQYVSEHLRVELLDGRFYYMNAGHYEHQWVADEVRYYLQDYIKKNNGNCKAWSSAPDVILGKNKKKIIKRKNKKDVLLPDVLVLCDKDKLIKDGIAGAPDLVVEVHSPSTRSYDIKKKLPRYRQAGVKEYWMVDIKKQCVTVCDFIGNGPDTIYGFDEKVPVGIFDGKCLVDFEAILRDIREWVQK